MNAYFNTPRILISGTNSGCGKTLISTGIMAALKRRGLKLQPFKVGPDYIDPMFHTFITGRNSRNLDSWILDEETVLYLFNKNSESAEIAVIEGMMGVFDGFGGHSLEGSTAHVAKIIKAPVILIIDCEGMALSIAALVQGFMNFDKELDIKGVIINNVYNDGHYRLLKQIIEDKTEAKVLGFLPKMQEFTLQNRHLGLVPSGEIPELNEKLDYLASQVEMTINLDLLLEIACSAQMLEQKKISISNRKIGEKRIKIAVARDKAFNFYYKDNLDLLEELGVDIVYFSPMEDRDLPEDISGIYIGGGYPEIWAKELEDNFDFREKLKECILTGMPVYAECGGLMYLSESIEVKAGDIYEMVGVIPGKSIMTSSLQRFGYVTVEMSEDNLLAKKGDRIRAHEFHFSETEVDPKITASYKVMRDLNDITNHWCCGYKKNNSLMSYPHLHFWANTKFAENFVSSCFKFKNKA